jgi:hypothetical protein
MINRSVELLKKMARAEFIVRRYCSKFTQDELNILEILKVASNYLEVRERFGIIDPPQVSEALKLLSTESMIELVDIYNDRN